jgi:hypothetical protein
MRKTKEKPEHWTIQPGSRWVRADAPQRLIHAPQTPRRDIQGQDIRRIAAM